jgi:L-ribulokinase
MERGRYALGLDFGTNSCRALIVDLRDGREVADHVFPYPHGEQGVLTDDRDPNLARQHPDDYLVGARTCVRAAVQKARAGDRDFAPDRIAGVGIDTTGSTPLPVDAQGVPLACDPAFRDRPAALAWLWKDHTAHAEAAAITERARTQRPHYLAQCGGAYSSEWFWSKIWRCLKSDPDVFAAAHSFVECCDWLPATLCGAAAPALLRRSVCAAGHKAMYARAWGGYPDTEFLAGLDPALAALRARMSDDAQTADQPAGSLSPAWAEALGLPAGLAVATGAFDAHMGAVGAGIAPGTLVKIIGTSSCDMLVSPNRSALADIPGVCGIVDGSILPGHFGIEAGQSAVGDLFLWFLHHLVPERYGSSDAQKFEALAQAAAPQQPGEHGLLALDWNNGNRTILADARLSGLILGQTLHTEAHEIYRALIEATAFGARAIVERIEAYGVPVEKIVNCGGLAVKNPLLMQIYADVLQRPMLISASDQTCALGAALFGAVAGGAFENVAQAQAALCHQRPVVYRPRPANREPYDRLYGLYRELHDAFGLTAPAGALGHVMKDLMDLRDRQRAGTAS